MRGTTRTRGAVELKKNDVSERVLFLAAAEKFPFLNSPCYETPKNAIKKSNKTTKGAKKTEEKNPSFCL
jgi:hypothetical protein